MWSRPRTLLALTRLSSYFRNVSNIYSLLDQLSDKATTYLDTRDVHKIQQIIENHSMTEFEASLLLTMICKKKVPSLKPVLEAIESQLARKEVYNPIAVSSLLYAISTAKQTWSEPTNLRFLDIVKANVDLLEHKDLARMLYGVIKGPTTDLVKKTSLKSFASEVEQRVTGFNGHDRGFLVYAYGKCPVEESVELLRKLIEVNGFTDKPLYELGYIAVALSSCPLEGDSQYFHKIQQVVMQSQPLQKATTIQLIEGFARRGMGSEEFYQYLEETMQQQTHDQNTLRLVKWCFELVGRGQSSFPKD